VVKRGIVIGITAAAVVVGGCAGCSSKKSDTGASSSATPSGPPAPQVVVDGQRQNITGQVACTPDGDNIKIGIGDPSNGVGAVVSNADPPIVHAVGLGNINGVILGFSDAAPGQNDKAGAERKGKAYAIKGTASGSDITNPQDPKPVSKTFEMTVTCP
jgi:ipoprotein LpqH